MKFEIYLLNRDGVFVTHGNVPAAISFFRQRGHGRGYSVMAHRNEKAIFIERVTDLLDLEKQLTEFMVKSASQA